MEYSEINIVFEDNHLLVAVKPQNVPSQEDESGDKDMLTLLKEYLKETYQKPGNAFLGLVHRLDRPTGGVMVFAKTSKAAARLSESMREGGFEKSYLAVTQGAPKKSADRLVHYLKKNPVNNTVYLATEMTENAKKAVLDYKVLETKGPVSLVRIALATGRSHQIRVQLSAVGAPVFGDAKYGGDKLAKGYPLCLWAYSLKFPHPVSGERMSFLVLPDTEAEPWKRFRVAEGLGIYTGPAARREET